MNEAMITNLSYYITHTTEPYENIALEEYWLTHVEPGQCILYLWQNRNTVVIGRNQNAWAECRVRELEEAGGFLARRLSGGGAVYHDMGNLNFTFLVRQEDYDVSRQLSVIEKAVRAFGLDAQKTGRNDVTVENRKFSGNAFYKTGPFCYHHGTLLVDVDTAKMSRFLNVSKEKLASKGVASVRSRVVNLSELAPEITVASLTDALLSSFSRVYGLPAQALPAPDPFLLEPRRAHFASWAWRLGSKTPFTEQVKHRFPWGDLSLSYTVERGRLTDLHLFSDGMEADFLSTLPEVLDGCLYDPKALEALSLPTENPLQETVLRDCIRLLKSQIE